MNILSVPFHQFLNIKRNDNDNFIFKIEERLEYLNHLGTIHACVQLTLAEATSGEFLLTEFKELETEVIPVVRKTEVKYRKPANGNLYSRASFVSNNKKEIIETYTTKGKVLIKIKVDVYDSEKNKTLSAIFVWFMIKNE